MEPVIQIKNLRTSFMTSNGEVQAVRGVSFSVNPGEILGVVGESGSGKSVTSMSILRLLADTAVIKENSEILFEGENLINVNKKKLRSIRGEKISMIFQDPMSSINPLIPVGKPGGEMSESITGIAARKKSDRRCWSCSARCGFRSRRSGMAVIRMSFPAVCVNVS